MKFSLNRSTGFTLIELSLAAVLILVIAGLAAPQFKKTFSGLAAKNAALSVSKLISYAQERAIVEQRNYRVKFDPAGAAYRLSASEESAGRLIYKDVPGKFGRIFSLPQGLSITVSAGGITMYPNGMCDDFRFTVTGRYGTGYLVRVKGFGASFDMREIRVEQH